jgi:hypothetical protein
MDKVKDFLHNNKKWIAALVAGLVAGATAAGYGLPAGLVDFLNSLVSSF